MNTHLTTYKLHLQDPLTHTHYFLHTTTTITTTDNNYNNNTHMQLLGQAAGVGLWLLLVLKAEGHGTEVTALIEHPLLRPFLLQQVEVLQGDRKEGRV